MKIYTATGDKGRTSLFSGERIAKDDLRIEAYGAVDELNAIVGMLMTVLSETPQKEALHDALSLIQSDLFHVGAWLATTFDSPATGHLPQITSGSWKRLESQIDAIQKELSALNAFILPGGHFSAGWAHVARTVCRRAERRAVSLAASSGTRPASVENLLVYMNRLSDYFFVLARYCNHLAGIEEITWHG
jgi:cob(I)alamin adenosyltransferase